MRVTLAVDTRDGNDPIEAEVDLPIVPRFGDTIEMWDDARDEELFPTACDVILSVCRPNSVTVYLRFEGFDIGQITRTMDFARRGVTP